MPPAANARRYGKPSKRSRAERLFAELPPSPVRRPLRAAATAMDRDPLGDVTEKLAAVCIHEAEEEAHRQPGPPRRGTKGPPPAAALDTDRDPVGDATAKLAAVCIREVEKESQIQPRTPRKSTKAALAAAADPVADATEKLAAVCIHQAEQGAQRQPRPPCKSTRTAKAAAAVAISGSDSSASNHASTCSSGRSKERRRVEDNTSESSSPDDSGPQERPRRVRRAVQGLPTEPAAAKAQEGHLRVLAWDDVCPPGDTITKIAEASYAEVYRVTNERGTSIIKVIRLQSPIKPQTKQQVKAGLVDEEPRSEDDVDGELQISEWLADIPGFVVYKEKYVVQGKAPKQLLETHQFFQRRMKRQDPERAQFYPSPSRYLDETKFLVIELGDAGTALEDWELADARELWDIFFLEAIALARAEETAMFEHRDLHEGNICIRRVAPPRERGARAAGFFGFSGLDITILDYGLSRAEDPSAVGGAGPVALDLEKDLSLFSSTHASQCSVYRQMRSFLLRGDRQCIPPEGHRTPYARGIDGPLSWATYAPYTNVLWLAYLYAYLVGRFQGSKRALAGFERETRELWTHLDPEAAEDVASFGCAADVVRFAVEAGWLSAEQLRGASASMMGREDSIIVSRDADEGEEEEESEAELPPVLPRRSPRKRAR